MPNPGCCHASICSEFPHKFFYVLMEDDYAPFLLMCLRTGHLSPLLLLLLDNLYSYNATNHFYKLNIDTLKIKILYKYNIKPTRQMTTFPLFETPCSNLIKSVSVFSSSHCRPQDWLRVVVLHLTQLSHQSVTFVLETYDSTSLDLIFIFH